MYYPTVDTQTELDKVSYQMIEDIYTVIFKNSEFKLKPRALPSTQRASSEWKNGRLDITLSTLHEKLPKDFYHYTNVPIISSSWGFYVLSLDRKSAHMVNPDSRIGVVLGGTYLLELLSARKFTNITNFPNPTALYKGLLAKRVDTIFFNEWNHNYLKKSFNHDMDISTIGTPYLIDFYIVFRSSLDYETKEAILLHLENQLKNASILEELRNLPKKHGLQ